MRLIKSSFEIERWDDNILLTLEKIGRICYKSEDKITEGSADKFIKMLIKRGHESVLEHVRFSFEIKSTQYAVILDDILDISLDTVGLEMSELKDKFIVSLNVRTLRDAHRRTFNCLISSMCKLVYEKYPIFLEDLVVFDSNENFNYDVKLLERGDTFNILPMNEAAKHETETVKIICDRGVSHEFVRHRVASQSQESTRYCNYSGEMVFIIPPWVDIEQGIYENDFALVLNDKNMSDTIWMAQMFDAESSYKILLREGWKPEQARSILPNSLKTELYTTDTLHHFRNFFQLRAAAPAHPQARELAYPMLDAFDELHNGYFKGDI